MRIREYLLLASLLFIINRTANCDGYNQNFESKKQATDSDEKTDQQFYNIDNSLISMDDQSTEKLNSKSTNILPNSDFSYTDTCRYEGTLFTVLFPSTDSVQWDFGDPVTGALNFSTAAVSQHIFSSSGNFVVQCIAYVGGIADTTIKQITIAPLPVVNMGIDTTLCSGDTHVLVGGTNPGATYLWQDGSTASTFSATASQTYYVTVTEYGCSASDSIILTFRTVLIFPTTDSTICNGSQVFLDITNSGTGFSFQWNDGYPDPYRFIDTDGVYIATVSLGNCTKTSTYTLHTLEKPTVYLGEDTILCLGGTWVLDASYPSSSYLWQDGSTGSTLNAVSTNAFGVQVSNQCGIDADSIFIEFVDCNCNLYFPKAFTPNKDNHNEQYNFKFDCLEFQSQFRIFNRWGTLVFESNDEFTGWDGTFEGKDADADAYIYVIKYTGVIDGKIQEEVKRGSFLLFR